MFRLLALFILIALPAEAFAQGLGVGTNFSTQSYSGRLSGQNKAPISLNQILSGNSSASSASTASAGTPLPSNYRPPSYKRHNNGAATSGVPYSFSMNPMDVPRNRAQRDAIAQRNQIDTLAYIQNDALSETYAEEYARYQEKLGLPTNASTGLSGISPFGAEKKKPVVRRNIKVRNKKSEQKMRKPRRVFMSNY